MQDYAPLQALHVFDVLSSARRASSVPPLPANWTPAKRNHAGSSHTLSLASKLQGRLGSQVKTFSSNSQINEQSVKLREYFLASIKNKRCPQKGKMTEQSRHDIQARKEERLQNLSLLALERKVKPAPLVFFASLPYLLTDDEYHSMGMHVTNLLR